MTTISGKHNGDLSVTGDQVVVVSGQVIGDVHVGGGVLKLRGQVTGSVLIGRDSGAEIHGMVIGKVINDGGEVDIYGMVGGVETRKGTTFIAGGAVVGGRRNSQDVEQKA